MKTRRELLLIAGIMACLSCASCNSGDDNDETTCNEDSSICLEGYSCQEVDGAYECVPNAPPKNGDENGKCLEENKCNGELVCVEDKCVKNDAPANGDENGKCLEENKCNGELVCIENKCVKNDAPADGDENGKCLEENKCNSEDLICKSGKCVIDEYKLAIEKLCKSGLYPEEMVDSCMTSASVGMMNIGSVCSDTYISDVEQMYICYADQVMELRNAFSSDLEKLFYYMEHPYQICTDFSNYTSCLANAPLAEAIADYADNISCLFHAEYAIESNPSEEGAKACIENNKTKEYPYAPLDSNKTCAAEYNKDLYNAYFSEMLKLNQDDYDIILVGESINHVESKYYLGPNYYNCLIAEDEKAKSTKSDSRDYSALTKILCENDPNVEANDVDTCIANHVAKIAEAAPAPDDDCADKYEEGIRDYIIYNYFDLSTNNGQVPKSTYLDGLNDKYIQCLVDTAKTDTITKDHCQIFTLDKSDESINNCITSFTLEDHQICNDEYHNVKYKEMACEISRYIRPAYIDCDLESRDDALNSCKANYGKTEIAKIDGADLSKFETYCTEWAAYQTKLGYKDTKDSCLNSIYAEIASVSLTTNNACTSKYYDYYNALFTCINNKTTSPIGYLILSKETCPSDEAVASAKEAKETCMSAIK